MGAGRVLRLTSRVVFGFSPLNASFPGGNAAGRAAGRRHLVAEVHARRPHAPEQVARARGVAHPLRRLARQVHQPCLAPPPPARPSSRASAHRRARGHACGWVCAAVSSGRAEARAAAAPPRLCAARASSSMRAPRLCRALLTAGRADGGNRWPTRPPAPRGCPSLPSCIPPPPNRLGWVFAHPPSSPYAAAAQRSRADGERRRAQGARRGAGTGGGLDNGAEEALAEPGEKARGAALARARHRLGEDAKEAVGYLAGRAGEDAVGQAAAGG